MHKQKIFARQACLRYQPPLLKEFSRSLRGAAGTGGHLMRKLLALTLSAPLLFAASSAFGADDSSHPGGYAIGISQSVSVVPTPSISLRYMATESLGFEVLGQQIEVKDTESTLSKSEFGLLVDYRTSSTDKVSYSGFFGIGFANRSEEVFGESDSTAKELSFSGGAKVEYFLARGFSISSRLGYTGTSDLDSDAAVSRFGGDLLGTMGVSLWFK
jgi:hypothetical protein